jgi:hypothetical protein
MVHIHCVRYGRKIDTKHERRKVNVSIQLFVTTQKMKKVDDSSFICTGECRSEHHKRKSTTQSLQHIVKEHSSDDEKVISSPYNQ